MSDDPNKKKLDGKRISQQPWEVAYQKRKKAGRKEHLTSSNIADKNVRRLSQPGMLQGTALLVVEKRKLESTLSKIERAASEQPVRGKVPFDFCKEWEQKGKPIFNLVLVLFSFNAKVKSTITRIMSGIDAVCGVPEGVGEV